MTSHSIFRTSSPSWGPALRIRPGGVALVAFALLLWALFLATVGRAPPAAAGAAQASTLRIPASG